MKNKKWIMIFVGIIILGIAGYYGYQRMSPKEQAGPGAAIPVTVFKAVQKDTPIIYEFVGDIRPLNEVNINARVSGLIVERYVNGGESVTEGQPLFKIDPRDYETNVRSAQSQVINAEISYNRSQQDQIRYKQLVEQGAISQQQYDIALASENQALAQVRNQQAALTQAELNLGYTVVRAPMNGKIGVDLVSSGTFATAGQTILGTVSSLSPVQVKFSLNESDYLKFSRSVPGGVDFSTLPIRLVLSDGSEYDQVGKIVEIDRGLNNQTGTLSMKAQFENPNNLLLPSMFARVILTGETRKDAILIPQRSVFMQLTASFVYVVNSEGKVEARPVTLGPKVGSLIMVDSGIQPGDQVIVDGQGKIRPGAPVTGKEIQEKDLEINSK